MKKVIVFLAIIIIAIPVFGYNIETVNIGGGRTLNYVFSTDYRELENFASTEFGVRISIVGNSEWDDNTSNDVLAPQLRSLMRQYTQQGRYRSFAMAIFTNNYGDVEEIIVNQCIGDADTNHYEYATTYFRF